MDISDRNRTDARSLARFADRLMLRMASIMEAMVRRDRNYLARGLITYPQLLLLRHLAEHPASSMHTLAAALGCTNSTVTGLVDRLVCLGLVRRALGDDDRRVVLADLTPKGRRILAEFRAEKRALILRGFRDIAPRDRARYLEVVEHIHALLDSEPPARRPRASAAARLGLLAAAALAAAQAGAGPYRGPSPSDAVTPGFDKAAFVAGASNPVTLRIGRVDCLVYALRNNTGLRIRRLDPILRTGDLAVARAAFEPSLVGSARLSDTRERSTTLLSSNVAHTRQADASVEVAGRLPAGTRYSLGLFGDRLDTSSSFQTLNPAYHLEPGLTLTQPLFRGAGSAVNRAAIRLAATNLKVSEATLRDTAMDVVSRTLAAYYELYDARTRFQIEDDALSRTEHLLEINRTRYAKGLISSVDLLETETAVAARRKTMIEAEARRALAEDTLKLVTNLADDPALWNARIELLDDPELGVQRVDLAASLERAFSNRPDYAAMTLSLANRDIAIQLARNDRLPTVDLIGSLGLNGVDGSFDGAADSLSTDYKDWMIGVQVTVPWGSGTRAAYTQRQWEKVQALLELKRLEQAIVFDVRDRVRAVDIQFRQTEAARLASDLEQRTHDAQQARYAAGEVSTHDMLDYQNRLASARRDYIKALMDYQVALIRLDQAEGTTLAKHEITLEP